MSDSKQIMMGPTGAAASTFQRQAVFEGRPVSALADRLKAEIERAGFWVLHEINPQAIVSRDGYQMPAARQLLFFHPKYMSQLLSNDQAALLEAPLKFALLEDEGRSVVRWIDPVVSFTRYENPTLAALGRELSDMCQAIVAAAV